jgi:hypothetical protein
MKKNMFNEYKKHIQEKYHKPTKYNPNEYPSSRFCNFISKVKLTPPWALRIFY